MSLILAADIGGTSARLQLLEVPKEEPVRLRFDGRYPTQDFSGLSALIRRFLTDANFSIPDETAASCEKGNLVEYIDACCVGICNPVSSERYIAGPGGVEWECDIVSDVVEYFGGVIRRAVLINDLVAVGFGLPVVAKKHLVTLHSPTAGPVPHAPMYCIGLGTGLGGCYVTWDAGLCCHNVWPSEPGMVEFCARNADELALKTYLSAECQEKCESGVVIVETIISGSGLANCFRFIRARNKAEEAFADIEDDNLPAAVVQGATNEDNLCMMALDILISALDHELRATAVRYIPTGGLYLVGGVTEKLLPFLQKELPQKFTTDPVNGELIRSIPLFACTDPDIGLSGAREHALHLLHNTS